jgi:hypothetical protein
MPSSQLKSLLRKWSESYVLFRVHNTLEEHAPY